jgi:hypothetical protein
VLPSASTPRAAGIAASSSPIRAVSLLICGGAADEVAGYVREALVGVAAVVAQQSEGLVHVDAEALGEFAFGLLDDDPAVQGGLELLGDGFAAAHVAFLQQADGGDIGEGLAHADVGRRP